MMNESSLLVRGLRRMTERNVLNVATTPLDKAVDYAVGVLGAGRFTQLLPDFERLYPALSKATRAAPDIPRIQMPVVEPPDIDQFMKDLTKGRVDIFRPSVFKDPQFPTDLLEQPLAKRAEWMVLGQKDGDPNDDVVKAGRKRIAARALKPTQAEIWLEKLIGAVDKFGRPVQGSSVTETTIIVSREGYILDGHHRYGQCMISDPGLKIDALHVPLNIELLLRVGRSYGNAIGHQQKQ